MAGRQRSVPQGNGGAEAAADIFDRAHFEGQTSGDAALASEVAALYLEQSARLLGVIAAPGPASGRRDAAHTLKGAARGLGAWRTAVAAETVESALDAPEDLRAPLAALASAVAQARRAIAAAFFGGREAGPCPPVR